MGTDHHLHGIRRTRADPNAHDKPLVEHAPGRAALGGVLHEFAVPQILEIVPEEKQRRVRGLVRRQCRIGESGDALLAEEQDAVRRDADGRGIGAKTGERETERNVGDTGVVAERFDVRPAGAVVRAEGQVGGDRNAASDWPRGTGGTRRPLEAGFALRTGRSRRTCITLRTRLSPPR